MLYSFFQVKKVFGGSVFSPFLLVKINTPQYSTAKAKFQLEIADGFSTWKAYTCYYAVRIFGSSHYGKSAISS